MHVAGGEALVRALLHGKRDPATHVTHARKGCEERNAGGGLWSGECEHESVMTHSVHSSFLCDIVKVSPYDSLVESTLS